MGWNSWNHFARAVTDADVRATADLLVSTGMRDAGYVYVNIDDTWQGTRDADGTIKPNERFPDMKALGDYIHGKGLKFGIYSSPGNQTCARFEGSLGHEAQDAQTYARWGVDFLKYDLCLFRTEMEKERAAHPDDPDAADKLMISAYRKMGDAIKATGRPMVYSLCQYGLAEPWKWGPSVGASMWRTTNDIKDSFDRMMSIACTGESIASYAGPGHWNDPDMLEIGNGGMNTAEYRTHMTIWVMQAAPLIAGNDLTKMTDADKNILMNREAIAIDQDSLGRQATRVWQRGELALFSRPLSGGRIAFALATSGTPNYFALQLSDLGLKPGAILHDVWNDRDITVNGASVPLMVPHHGALLFTAARDAGR